MKIGIISGSNRADSGSRKVTDYCMYYLKEELGHETELLDMHEVKLPLWSEDVWNKESEHARQWSELKAQLGECDGYIIVAAEWNGTIPPSLQNLIMHFDRNTVGHKPALLIGVSAGRGGAYPIHELKASINKNNRMLVVPDYVIVRDVNDVFENKALDESQESDYYLKSRSRESIDELIVYAKHCHAVRDELDFDYSRFTNGM